LLSSLISYLDGFSAERGRGWEVKEVSTGFNEDFMLLARASILLGSVSTYSFWAAIVNSVPGAHIVLPACDLFFRFDTPSLPLRGAEETANERKALLETFYTKHDPSKLASI
jgi:hypothetical protein